jgi:beta-N-acetylhexosaminidase
VEKYAKILIEEHHSLGILATLKHFPGHGSSSSDTHQTAADVASSWSQDELVPYQRLSSAGIVDAVMVGHLINELEWGGVATQKGSTAISGLLRGKLNFDGVVISDDLAMDAVRTSKDNFAAVLVSSFNAGVDIALVAHPVREGNEDDGQYLNSAVTNSIAAGEIAVESIRKSWQRVNSLKAKVNSNGAPILPRN